MHAPNGKGEIEACRLGHIHFHAKLNDSLKAFLLDSHFVRAGLEGGDDCASTGENKVTAEVTAIINTRTGIKILFIL